MTPEGKVKKAVKKFFEKEEDIYYFMPVQMGYGKQGLDFHCSYKGAAFFVETKARGKELTPIQKNTKADMEASGAPVFVVYAEEDIEAIAQWMMQIDSHPVFQYQAL